MNARELWQKLVDEKCASFDSTKKVLTPLKHLKIKGDVIKNLTRDANGKITINLAHQAIIDHPGENIDYSLYGTPMESTTYKFAKCLKRRFGDDIFVKLDGKDRDYITNSYHVAVFEKINPFDKIAKEAKFQRLSPGGAISYIETANLTGNVDAVMEVIKFIYDNIMYAELNTKSDYCQNCGYDGEILIDDNMEWYCPNCGCRDHSKLNVARRTCGYIGSNFWNTGRTNEIRDRFVSLDNIEDSEA